MNSTAGTLITVSYTHLDVYKRQGHHTYNALDYPQMADDGIFIYPATCLLYTSNSYITNEYDSEGRVTVQRYPDGSRSTVEYRPHKRESLVCIEAFDRTERYCYNEDGLITHSYFDDGTCIEYGYDQWQNRIYEKDRLGNVTTVSYTHLDVYKRQAVYRAGMAYSE